jgi:hypothetical protein
MSTLAHGFRGQTSFAPVWRPSHIPESRSPACMRESRSPVYTQMHMPKSMEPLNPVDLAQTRRRRKKKRIRPISLSHEETLSDVGVVASTDPSRASIIAISTDEAWDCAPSVSWVIMYFVLIAMVAVSMRLYPDPIIRTSAKVK